MSSHQFTTLLAFASEQEKNDDKFSAGYKPSTLWKRSVDCKWCFSWCVESIVAKNSNGSSSDCIWLHPGEMSALPQNLVTWRPGNRAQKWCFVPATTLTSKPLDLVCRTKASCPFPCPLFFYSLSDMLSSPAAACFFPNIFQIPVLSARCV